MIRRAPAVDPLYGLENAAAAVRKDEGKAHPLACYINCSSAHGYLEEQVRLKLA